MFQIFIRPNLDYGNAGLITAENKYVYKWEQIQIRVLIFPLNLSRGTSNGAIRNCGNAFTIEARIKDLTKSWIQITAIRSHFMDSDHCESDSYS